MDMDVALDQWLKQVTKIAELPISEQEKVTKAGADVFAKKLIEATQKKHPSTKGNGGKYGHLVDNIASQKGDVDGQHNGESSVGFHNKAYIARFLNDGTKTIRGDHFVDNTRDDVKDDVFAAESVAYKKIVDKIQGGDGH